MVRESQIHTAMGGAMKASPISDKAQSGKKNACICEPAAIKIPNATPMVAHTNMLTTPGRTGGRVGEGGIARQSMKK